MTPFSQSKVSKLKLTFAVFVKKVFGFICCLETYILVVPMHHNSFSHQECFIVMPTKSKYIMHYNVRRRNVCFKSIHTTLKRFNASYTTLSFMNLCL